MGIKGNYQSQDQKMGQKTLPQPFSIKKSFKRISPFWTHKNNKKTRKTKDKLGRFCIRFLYLVMKLKTLFLAYTTYHSHL